jgi:hypothetical protein
MSRSVLRGGSRGACCMKKGELSRGKISGCIRRRRCSCGAFGVDGAPNMVLVCVISRSSSPLSSVKSMKSPNADESLLPRRGGLCTLRGFKRYKSPSSVSSVRSIMVCEARCSRLGLCDGRKCSAIKPGEKVLLGGL